MEHPWPMSIRELTEEDKALLAGMDEPVCGWPGCGNAARWEVVWEDVQDIDDLIRSQSGLKIDRAGKSLPFSELTTTQSLRAYCNEHARRLCLDGGIDVPHSLSA